MMTSIRLLPGRLAMGPVLPFVAVSLGQAAGSPCVGKLVAGFGYPDSFAMSAVVGTLVAIMSPLYPRYLEYETPKGEIEDETGLQAAFDYQLQDEDGEPLDIAAGED